MPQIKITIPDEFHRRLKARAALEGINIPVMAERILVESLECEPIRQAPEQALQDAKEMPK